MAINNGKQGGCTLRVASSREDFESFRKIALDFSRFLNVDLSFQVLNMQLLKLFILIQAAYAARVTLERTSPIPDASFG